MAFYTPAFHIYFPQGNDSLCAIVSRSYKETETKIRLRMGTGMSDAPNIILYPSIDQLYETNVGSNDQRKATFPTFAIKGNRIVLAFNGSADNLKGQLAEAIARNTWESQNNNLTDQALEIQQHEQTPYWFKEGAIRYFAQQWPVQAEYEIQRLISSYSPSSWEQVISYNPILAGQAFCYYLAQEHYRTAVMQVYFQIRKRKRLPAALRLITKSRIDALFTECLKYYQTRIPKVMKETPGQLIIAIAKKRNTAVQQILCSPDHQVIIYVLSTGDRRTVYVYSVPAKTTRKITSYSLAPWILNHAADNYPLLNWSNNYKTVQVTIPRKGKLETTIYSIAGAKLDNCTLDIDGVMVSPVPVKDGLALFAWKRAQTASARYDTHKDKIISVSTFDPDFYNCPGNADPLADRMIPTRPQIKTDTGFIFDSTSFVRQDNFIITTSGGMLFRSSGSGNLMLYYAPNVNKLQGAYSIGNYRPFQYIKSSDEVITWSATPDSVFLYSSSLKKLVDGTQKDTATSAWLIDYNNRQKIRDAEDSILRKSKEQAPGFLDGVLGNNSAAAIKSRDSINSSLQYNPKKVQPYILQLYSAYFSAQVNNDYYINRYQPYLNYQGQFKFPEIGGMAQGGFSDLFENHHFTMAYRMPAGTEGSDFFVKYWNTAKRLDWGLMYFRKVEQLQPDQQRAWVDDEGRPYPDAAKVRTNYYEIQIHYPLTWYSSVNFSTGLRNDRTIFLSTETYSLKFPPIKSLWNVSSLSYEVNKRKPTLTQLYRGFTAKATVDVFKGFTQAEHSIAGCTIDFNWHQPLYKYITLATHIQGGYSGGDDKILYLLGGVDNNITPRVDSTVHFAQDAPYAFTTLVAPFRGYLQNTIYGSRYALANIDIYFPIFQTLIPIETPLPSINNLQLGIFTDWATTGENWKGYRHLNTALSLGFNARTTLAGYPLRFDMGWPSAGGKPVWYLSIYHLL